MMQLLIDFIRPAVQHADVPLLTKRGQLIAALCAVSACDHAGRSLVGKNDGSVRGVRYFHCRSQHGVFVRHDKLVHGRRRMSTRTNTKVAKLPTNLRRSTGNLLLSSPKDGTAATANTNSSLMRPTAASSAKHK